MAGTTSAEIIVPANTVASTLLVTGAAGLQATLIATATTGTVWIGPSGVTPQNGTPLPKGKPLTISVPSGVVHGVVGENQGAVAVRVLTTS